MCKREGFRLTVVEGCPVESSGFRSRGRGICDSVRRWPEVVNGLEQVGQTCFFLTFSASTISLAVWMGGGAMVEGWVGGAGGGGSEGVLAERAGVDAALVEVDAGSMFSGGGRASYEYAESGGEGKGERPAVLDERSGRKRWSGGRLERTHRARGGKVLVLLLAKDDLGWLVTAGMAVMKMMMGVQK
ncbi:hypothetical protein M407DRAFT_10585 [Tulasnella calospora MUT 4182]|uniref:Uncharacterized protein n=1 Tax=Tulasnella calospora MUT 4182 TaxID=1051891 RepID=A0A0C3KHU5_9AGAM|nr:hypothetical protein M407DRAFT_10585 [Tulasnella calospora MUT 4182]